MFYCTEMGKNHFGNRLKLSSVISKVEQQVSKNWKNCFKPHLKNINKFWGPIVLGTIRPWWPNEPGLFVLGDRLWETKCSGTECVQDQLRSSRRLCGCTKLCAALQWFRPHCTSRVTTTVAKVKLSTGLGSLITFKSAQIRI